MKLPLLLSALLLGGLSATGAMAVEADYLRDVKPILKRKCYACHGALKQQNGLRLDTARAILEGGDSGPAITAGAPESSLLIDVLNGDAGFQMPPENDGVPLEAEEIEIVRAWIKAGGRGPSDEQPQQDPRSWWSYRPLEGVAIPAVAGPWRNNPIDAFVEARRTAMGLTHAPPADKAIWLRRVYLDLIGLPPTREELQRFLTDKSAEAEEAVVDDLLSRPQYGERWGRHWMDVWRYSDWYGSRGGNEIRYSQRHIWRWRDWIVNSLNNDKGYDQMLREMLAADEMPQTDASTLAATGYLGRSWYKFDRNVWLFETVERAGEAFLGMTLRCCRCHDHKFDPVTQEEYYRFRAFFEPHDVRTDRVSALTGTQKDSKLGEVPQDGLSIVFDKHPERETYRFERGDDRRPDKSRALKPGTPMALGSGTPTISPIELPPRTWYPALREGLGETYVTQAEAEITSAKEAKEKAEAKVAQAANALAKAPEKPEMDAAKPFLHDNFDKADQETWQTVSGEWVYENERLIEKAVTSFATIVTKKNHPRDFRVHLRYRPLRPGDYRSIGFSFDYQDQGQSQDVYTSTGDASQSVQAFHRTGGRQVYPREGIVKTKLEVEKEATLDVIVQGSRLTIDLNGERKLDYRLPIPRRDGRFALWVHSGSAEFLELKIDALHESKESLQQRLADAKNEAREAALAVAVAQAKAASIQARLRAERAKYLGDGGESPQALAEAAARAEREAEVREAELAVAKAKHSGKGDGVEKQVAEAEKKLEAAVQRRDEVSQEYKPLGPQHLRNSTGRRTALADWLTSSSNPRTARVAANHIWSRHFGSPLVATPENFGLNGRKPTHPGLLDWLANQLIANQWKMKPLHRAIVLSKTYRMASRVEKPENNRDIDPENRLLWRMNERRMEAEIVRDSVLYLAGRLDLKQGGPELVETQGETTLRRSIYFRNTPNERMPMLEVFDMANPNACYRRRESVVPHQSLALMNSGLVQDSARTLTRSLVMESDFVAAAFETVLCQSPTEKQRVRCETFLKEHEALLAGGGASPFPGGGASKVAPSKDLKVRAKENLLHVLLLHNDFVTIR